MPAACTRIRTVPGRATGSVASRTSITSGGPRRGMTTCFTCRDSLLRPCGDKLACERGVAVFCLFSTLQLRVLRLCGGVVQLADRPAVNRAVGGSSPPAPAPPSCDGTAPHHHDPVPG